MYSSEQEIKRTPSGSNQSSVLSQNSQQIPNQPTPESKDMGLNKSDDPHIYGICDCPEKCQLHPESKEEMRKEIIEFIEQIKWDGRLSQGQMLDAIKDFINK
jgi:hypothetical protein